VVNIRAATTADFPRLIELFTEFAEFERLPEKMTNSVEKMTQESEYFHGFVATNEENIIVGYATYFFCYFTWTGKSLYMDDLYVQKSFRKCGIGKQLLESVIHLAKESYCKRVRWQVSSWNDNAKSFYQSMGAKIDDVESNCDLIL
jgi:ribosomal protein S18 acetylase RimI-like enzyme